MGSYKLYVAVMAIASIAAVQKASCAGEPAEQYSELEEVSVENSRPKIEHHECNEYKSKIWDKAFSNQAAMQLMKLTFITAKELGSDEVCSDTTRSIFSFVNVMATNQNAHYVFGMLEKMVGFIVREADMTSDKFKETSAVFERIAKDAVIRDFVKYWIVRTVDLLKTPETRGRLFRVLKAFEGLIKPSENEQMTRQRLKGLSHSSSMMAKGAMNKFGSFLRNAK